MREAIRTPAASDTDLPVEAAADELQDAAGAPAGVDRQHGRGWRRLILPVAACAGAATLATVLAIALARRSRAATAAPPNVNWGLAIFGANVIGAPPARGRRFRRIRHRPASR